MTLSDLAYLSSPQGEEDYKKYQSLKDQELERLVLKGEISGALASLVKNRRLAASKFSKAQEMFFDRSALEQATSELIARHLAARFLKSSRVADLGCGLGANSIFLAIHGCQVLALDQNPSRLKMAQLNATVYDVSERIEFKEADFLENLPQDVEAIFIDPARNLPDGTKTRSLKNSQPNIIELLPRLLKITPQVAVKISPAFDYEELKELPEEPELELISENGVCKVAMLWFGDFKKTQRSASVLKNDSQFTLQDDEALAAVFSEPQAYLYLPDKAVSKARLVDEFAVQYELSRINSRYSLLTSESLSTPPMTRRFKIISQGAFSLKQFKKILKAESVSRAEIIAHDFPLTAEALRERLKLGEGGAWTIFLLNHGNTHKYYILANNI